MDGLDSLAGAEYSSGSFLRQTRVRAASDQQREVWPIGFWTLAPGRIPAGGGATGKRENSQT